jgi:glutamate receptor 3
MVGTMNAESFHTYHAFANTFHMPLITPWYPTKDVMQVEGSVTSDPSSPSPYGQGQGHRGQGKFGSSDYATRLRPDFNPAILETIRLYGWKDIIYLYSTNEGLLRLQTLFYRQNLDKNSLRLKAVKKIQSAKDAIGILKEIEGADRYGPKYVLLDAPTALAKEIIVSHVRDVQLGRRTYHYLLAGLAFDDGWEREVLEFQAVNVTSFRMVDPARRYVQDFFHKWSSLDTMQYSGAGKKSISVWELDSYVR